MNTAYKAFKGTKLETNAEDPGRDSGEKIEYPGFEHRTWRSLFRLKEGETRKLTIVSNPEVVCVARSSVGWVNRSGNNFAIQRYHRRSDMRVSEDRSHAVPTNEPCLLGESDDLKQMRILSFWALQYPFDYKKADGVKATAQPTLVVVEFAIKSNAWNVYSDAIEPAFMQFGTALGVTFMINRWANNSKCSIGENWRPITNQLDPATNQITPLYDDTKIKSIIAGMNKKRREASQNPGGIKVLEPVGMDQVYPLMTDEQKQAIIDCHIELETKHNKHFSASGTTNAGATVADNDVDFFGAATPLAEEAPESNDPLASADGSDMAKKLAADREKAKAAAAPAAEPVAEATAEPAAEAEAPASEKIESEIVGTFKDGKEEYNYWIDGNVVHLELDELWVSPDGLAWDETEAGVNPAMDENNAQIEFEVKDIKHIFEKVLAQNNLQDETNAPEVDIPDKTEGATEDDAGSIQEDDVGSMEATDEQLEALRRKDEEAKKKATPKRGRITRRKKTEAAT